MSMQMQMQIPTDRDGDRDDGGKVGEKVEVWRVVGRRYFGG
jgi:hypothetical protein